MGNNFKRFLAFVLAFAMVFAYVPANAFAAEADENETAVVTTDVAKIGEQGYASLADAIKAAQAGDTITLLADNAEEFEFAQNGGNITIDGNGFTFTGKITLNAGSGNLTITNATLTPSNADAKTIVLNATTAPNVTIVNCTLKNVGTKGAIVWGQASYTNNKVVIKNSTASNLQYLVGTNQAGCEDVTVENVTATNMAYLVRPMKAAKVTVKNITYSGLTFVQVKNSVESVLIIENVNVTTTQAGMPPVTMLKPDTGNGVDYTIVLLGDNVVNGAEMTNVNADAWFAKENDNNECNIIDAVAMVNGQYYGSLQDAVNAAANGQTVTLLTDCAENITVTQKSDVKFTIDGNGKTMTGAIVVDGMSEAYATAGVTIKNFKFDATSITLDACINLGTGSNTNRYTSNVTVEKCTFTGGNLAKVAIKSYTGGDKNLTVIACTVDSTMHSLLQAANIAGVVIDGCTVNSKNGINLNSSSDVEIKNSTVSVSGYAVRIGANGGTSGEVTLTGNTLKTTGTEDAVVVLRGTAPAQVDLTMSRNVVSGATHISGTTAETQIEAEGNYWDGKNAPVVSGTAVEVKTYYKDEALTQLGDASHVVLIGTQGYASLAEAIEAATAGQTITFLADITENVTIDKNLTIDGAGKTYIGTMTISDNKVVTIENVNFVNGCIDELAGAHGSLTVLNCEFDGVDKSIGYAITHRGGDKLVIENSSAKNYSTGMLYVPSSVTTITVKDVAVENCTVAFNITYSGDATFENISLANVTYGIHFQIHKNGSRTYTVKNSDLSGATNPFWFWDKSSNTAKVTVVFEGDNIVPKFQDPIPAGALKLAAGATLTAAEGLTITTDVENGNVVYKNGVYFVQTGLAGSGTETDPYLIGSVEDLILFRDSVNAGETKYSAPGVYVALTADIDMAGINWVGIGSATADHGFMGNFDGKGYKIKNLTITDPALDGEGYAYAGLFAVTEGTDKDNQNFIKNLIIENVTISTTGHIVAAAIAYPYYTIVENVTVCGDIAIKGGDYTAGALAYTRRCVNASNVTVSGNEGSTITGAQVVGGVISDIQMNGGLIANYSNFTASGLTITGTLNVGGISGIIAGQTLNGATVKNVELVCSDARVGIVSGSLGAPSTITGVVAENVTGATALIGATYDKAEPVAAKIGYTYYATLEAALDAAQPGDVIELLAPVVVKAGETLTLDKAVTITYTSNVPGEDMITNKGTLVIDGATLVYTNTDTTATNVTVSTISSEAGSVLEVKSGIVRNDSENNGAKEIYAFAIDLLTNGSLGDVTATIYGGEIISTNYMAIRQFNNGDACKNTLNVKGGYIYGAKRAIQVHLKNDAAYLTIEGGKIAAGEGGYALCLFPETATHIAVTGGEFIGAVYSGTNGIISGGTYSEELYAGYIKEGFVPVNNGDGTYGVQEYEWNGVTIANVRDLEAFRDAVNDGNNFAGKTITLVANIDLSSVENWEPIGNVDYNKQYAPVDPTKAFSGVFDGNGYAISNLKMTKIMNGGADAEANLGLFGITGEGAVIKNLTLTNVTITTDGRNVGALVAFAYKATLENITVNGDIQIKGGNNVSGVCAMSRHNAMSAINITVKGNDGSSIVGNNIVGGIFAEIAPNGAAQTFKNLSIENVAITGAGGVGGIVGLLTEGSLENVSVKNVALTGRTDYQGNAMGRIRLGSVAGLMGGKTATIANATVTNVTAKNLEGNAVELPIIGANYSGDIGNATEAKIGDTYYATLAIAVSKAQADDTITLLADGGAANSVAKALTIVKNGYTATVTAAEGYVVEDTETSYVVKKGLKGTGTQKDPFQINNLDDLILFRDSVNAGETRYNASGVYVALFADIDMKDVDWSVNIGDDCNATFDGIFDGQNHIISNLTSTETAQKGDVYVCTGLFGAIYGNAVVKNLTIDKATINTGDFTGNNAGIVVGFAYNATGSIENVKVTNSTLNASEVTGVGAIVGYDYYSPSLTIQGCSVTDTTIIGKAYVGGVVGYASTKIVIADCSVENATISGTASVAGIAGILVSGGKVENASVKSVNVSATGELWANSAAIVAGTMTKAGYVTISGTQYENVNVTDIVGGILVEKPTEPIAKIEAKIGDAYYATFAKAYENAQAGQTIELLAPVVVEADETLTLDKAVTITYTSNVPGEDMITNRGTLVIDGATLVYTNTDTTATNVTVSTISNVAGGKLTVISGMVRNASAHEMSSSIYPFAIDNYNGAEVIVSGGTVQSDNWRSIRMFVNSVDTDNVVTISGGELIGQVWLQSASSKQNKATLTISGGSFQPTNGDMSSVFITKDSSDAVSVSITGGNFATKIGSDAATGFISGGTFTAAAKANTAESLLADGYVFVENTDGTYGVEKLFDISFASMTMANSLDMNFAFEKGHVEDWTGHYAEIRKEYADGREDVVQIVHFANWKSTTIEGVAHYYVTFTGIAAKEMTDNLYVTIYNAEGKAVSNVWIDSVQAQAHRNLAKEDVTELSRTMVVDMLNYGAAAQRKNTYALDNLANAELTEEQKGFATESVTYVDNSVHSDNYRANILMVSNLQFIMAFKGINQDMRAVVTFTNHKGQVKEIEIDGSEFVKNGNFWMIYIEETVIADGRQEINCKVYDGDTLVEEVTDSIESYAARAASGENGYLYDALMKFSDSAYAYLHNK